MEAIRLYIDSYYLTSYEGINHNNRFNRKSTG